MNHPATSTTTPTLATAQQAWSRWRAGPALLGLLAGWVALLAWSDLVSRPRMFLVPSLAIGLVVVGTGVLLRGLAGGRVPSWVVAAAQVLVTLLGLHLVVATGGALGGLVPTVASLREVGQLVVNGGATLNTYTSPVSDNPRSTQALLLLCALGVLLSIELLTTWARRLPLVALPLLVTLAVPVSILFDALDLWVFAGVTLLYLRLVATDQLDRLARWRTVDGTTGSSGSAALARSGTLWQVSGAAVLVAALLAPLVPVSDVLQRQSGSGPGPGAGAYQLTTVNPFIRLRRDLLEMTNTPLVYAQTSAPRTSYLRTTVLDRFTSDEWRPSPRELSPDNEADGIMPQPPGLGAGVAGTTSTWELQLAPNFLTTWLPTPYPLREVDIEGNWRYDERTLDIALVGGRARQELEYSVIAFDPDLDSRTLDDSVVPPARIRAANTELPDDLPQVLVDRAREITRGAETNYDKAVALQDWFREDGGFTYSTDARGGSGMDLLARFVTDDRIGYCEQFASAMAAMGRVLDIPSRVVVGFLDGTRQPDGRILYTSDDRHAWPEMYFSGIGWVRFEPTPGQRAGETPPWTREETPQDDPSAAPSAEATPSAEPEAADQTSADQTGGFSLDVPWWGVGGGLLLVVLALGPWTLRRWQRRRRLGGEDLVDLSEGAWAELRATAIDLGLPWPESRSPREQARGVLGQVRAEPHDEASLDRLLGQVERGRYAPAGTLTADPAAQETTRRAVGTWRRLLRRTVERDHGRLRILRARLLPLSLVRREPRD